MSYIKDLREKIGHQTIIMPCACVIIGDGKGNVLLQLRNDDLKWGHHGGAVEVDENIIDALKREIKEELNITLDEIELLGVYSGEKYHHIYPNKDEVSCIDIVYICHKYHGTIKYNDGEVKQVKWFNSNNFPENFSENPKDAFKDYFKKYFNETLKI